MDWVLIQMCLISHSECVTKKIKYHLPVLNKSWKFFLIDLFIVGNPFSICFLIIFRPRSKMVVPMFYTAHPQVFVHPPPSTSCRSCTSRVCLSDPPRLYCFYNQEMVTIWIQGKFHFFTCHWPLCTEKQWCPHLHEFDFRKNRYNVGHKCDCLDH